MMIDTHIHLSHFSYQSEFPFLSMEGDAYCIQRGTRNDLIELLQAAGIRACIDPGIELESNQRLLSLAQQYSGFLFPAVGVHPTRTFEYKTMGKTEPL